MAYQCLQTQTTIAAMQFPKPHLMACSSNRKYGHNPLCQFATSSVMYEQGWHEISSSASGNLDRPARLTSISISRQSTNESGGHKCHLSHIRELYTGVHGHGLVEPPACHCE